MESLIAAVLSFIAIHVVVSGTRLRDRIVAGIGEGAYLALFSLASLALVTWIVIAYQDVRPRLPTDLRALLPLAWATMLIATILVVLGVLSRPPTAVGGERALDLPADQAARGVHRITRHPFLWGVVLWAAVHLVFNRDPASLWLFGGFLTVAIVGPALIDRKRARRFGERWQRYARATSNVPFLAIIQGRNHLAVRELADWRLIAALAAFAALLLLHGRLFGMTVA